MERPKLRPSRHLLWAYKRKGLTAPEEIARNDGYVQAAKPDLIREAGAHLCRFTFQRNLNLIFGAHPSIAPMVLEAARRFGATAGRKQVLVFQSAFFESDFIPRATRLARQALQRKTFSPGLRMLSPGTSALSVIPT